MWQPQSIAFTNLFSHPETYYEFKQNQMDLLLGKNLDKNGSDSNGSGKSCIIESISLAVTGEVYRKVSKTEFIRRGEKVCITIFRLIHSVTKEKLRIERQFFRNTKSSTIRIFEDDVEKTTLTNLNEANKYVFTKLGISKEDFLNYYVIGQDNPNSFFAASDGKQKEVIARFSNYERIDLVLNQLKIEVDELNEELHPYDEALNSVDAIIEHIEAEIEVEQTKFQQAKQQKLDDKQLEIDEVNIEIQQLLNKIAVQTSKLLNSDKELKVLKSKVKNTETLKVNLANQKQSLATLRQELKEINTTIAELNNQSGAVLNCPKCGVAFIPNSDLEPEEVEALIIETIQLRENTIVEEGKLEVELEEIRDQINTQAELASSVRIKESEIKSFSDLKQNYQNQFESKNSKLKNLLIEFQAIKSSKAEKSNLELKSKLQIQKSDRILIEDKIKEIKDQIVDKQFFQYHFGKSGLKTYLANKSIKAINDVTNYYLDSLGTNLQVKISGYKVLKSGEVRDQIETKVIADGIDESLFNAFSGGEKVRIDACGAVAINFMINNNSETGGLNLLIFDERSFLDSEGQVMLVNTLAKLQMTSILVLHHIDNLPYKNKTIVEKKNKISRIVEYIEPEIDMKKLLQLQN